MEIYEVSFYVWLLPSIDEGLWSRGVHAGHGGLETYPEFCSPGIASGCGKMEGLEREDTVLPKV